MSKKFFFSASALTFISATFLIQGCAGLESKRAAPNESIEGVAYYMPMKYFILTIERKEGVTTKAEWSATDIFADTSQVFYLKYNSHLIGKTETSILVNSTGLLGSATTKVSDSAAALSTIVKTGPLVAKGLRDEKDGNSCQENGTTVFIFDMPKQGQVCNDVDYYLSLLQHSKVFPDKKILPIKNAGESENGVAGVFYKQEKPYIAEAKIKTGTGSITSSQIILAANNSPVMLLPYARTLFSANDGKITFSKGIPTEYTQSTDGEFVALLKIPAVVLSAYFTAVGNVFNAFSSKEADEQALALERYKLAVMEHKLFQCKEAFEKDDKSIMTALNCDDLSKK